MRRSTWRCCIPLFCLIALVEVRGTDFVPARIDAFTNTGTVLAYVLPATALGLTACFKDGVGSPGTELEFAL